MRGRERKGLPFEMKASFLPLEERRPLEERTEKDSGIDHNK